MQGLADGYFIVPATIGNYLATQLNNRVSVDQPEFVATQEQVRRQIQRLLSIKGKRSVTSFHRELGLLLWEKCGMARSAASLKEALQKIPGLREEFWQNVNVLGDGGELNQALEQAGRVADFLEFAELLCQDALERNESCGGHFRIEYQTKEGEALRNDDEFCHVAAWQYNGPDQKPIRNIEPLQFESVHLAQRSYK
jgi:succinate dehydrogenase flavoprotein subunit